MLNEEIFLNPNEPNPGFMVHKDEARKVLLKAIAGKSECFWVLGKTGIGKTTFLLWLNEFAPVYRVKPILIHGGETLTLDEVKTKVEQAIKPSFFSRVFLRKKVIERPVLLLIDEVEYIKDERVFQYIISKLDDDRLQMSVVLASVEIVDEIIKNYLRGRDIEKIYLEMPPVEILMEMIRKRIEAAGGEGFKPFGKQMVRDIIESSSTIREVLVKLEEALR
ncbi:MAG: AAA family ATPase [Thermoplasmata archaeon]|nr:MAG: AAA family ATPase [Thermoplasmata archaeon]HDH81996.1 AAA family ATPase [Thermoplasmatales archaeon]RLF43698.1 MAG: hypothetical protein DRN17_05850 [Thermoplasmata archaeon]RLF48592.1 MAG: hypothetical protein DRN10_02325 [Thermoplasmata archaeon]RLF63548.1 MAG: hypothetical protein DRN31_02215 [Thermoplasmata archaeon]